jgi:uncharacterized protein YgbK (DUF1537 family)
MSKILVIADDLTGAAEIAGIAFSANLKVHIVSDIEKESKFDQDVVVVNSNTRGMNVEDAIKSIEIILMKINLEEFTFIYKKVDSVLRGWVIEEILTILKNTSYSCSVLIPANPSKKRIIKDGHYYIDKVPLNQTQFGNDPDFPRNHSHLNKILSNDLIACESVTNRKLDQGRIYIPDVLVNNDIKDVVANIDYVNVLFAGAADFFKVILFSGFRLTKQLKSSDKQIFLLGSFSNSRVSTLKHLRKQGYQIFQLPYEAITEYKVLEKWEKQIFKSIQSNYKLAIATPELKVEGSDASKLITSLLTQIIYDLYSSLPYRAHFYIEGGETAASFCKHLGFMNLEVVGFLSDGIVTLKDVKSEQLMTIKPGSYIWPFQLMNNI